MIRRRDLPNPIAVSLDFFDSFVCFVVISGSKKKPANFADISDCVNLNGYAQAAGFNSPM
jgi:hypothetical protein